MSRIVFHFLSLADLMVGVAFVHFKINNVCHDGKQNGKFCFFVLIKRIWSNPVPFLQLKWLSFKSRVWGWEQVTSHPPAYTPRSQAYWCTYNFGSGIILWNQIRSYRSEYRVWLNTNTESDIGCGTDPNFHTGQKLHHCIITCPSSNKGH